MNGALHLRQVDDAFPVRHGMDIRALSSLDAWAWQMQGQGPGSITGGENAYSGLVGALPSEIIWAGFHGAYSPITVAQNLQIQMWSQRMRIKITGNWDRIFEHFSGSANATKAWFSTDIKAEFNTLRYNGGIQVELDIDGTVPGAQEMEQATQSRIDAIVAQFMEQAKKVIFEPAPPTVKAAESPSGGYLSKFFAFGNAGFALKYRRDETRLDLTYEETRNFRYLQTHTISSSLEGFFNEIKKDPDAESKFFTRLVIGELGRKVHRIIKPVVNWPDRSKGWAGDPVAFLSAEVGYPDSQGGLQWKAETFQAGDPADRTWEPVFVMRREGEVKNPPSGWQRDETYIRRKVHLLEPPGEDEFPHMKVYVERNEIELDTDPMNNPSNVAVLEVRAENAGVLTVGPMAISAQLEAASQVVEVEIRVLGRRADGTDRLANPIRFRWTVDDQNTARYLKIFTGQADFVPSYEYRVHVTVKGTLFSKGMAWSGPWTPGNGNGPLMIQVPAPGDPGIVPRSLTVGELASEEVVRVDAVEELVPATGRPGAPRGGKMTSAPRAPRTEAAPVAEMDLEERTVDGYEIELPTSPRSTQSTSTRREPGETNSTRTSVTKSDSAASIERDREKEPEGYVRA